MDEIAVPTDEGIFGVKPIAVALPPEALVPFEFASRHERRQFEFFAGLNHPHFGLCARVAVGPLRAYAKTSGIGFHLVAVHALSTAANAVPALRRRVRDGATVVEHAAVHPSFTVPSRVGAGFTFCEVPFERALPGFAEAGRAAVERVAAEPSLEDAPGRDDYLFLSAIPWVDFTGIQHAMQYHPHDCVPRISWGKVVPADGGGEVMAVSIQAHHALVDGSGLGEFYAAFERYVTAVADGQ